MRAWQAFTGVLCAAVLALICVAIDEPIVDLKIDEARTDLGNLQSLIDIYRHDTGSLPSELSTLLDKGFIGKLPADPWGTAYVFRLVASERGYVIYSAGRDTVDQRGAGDDIITGEKQYRCDVYGVNCPMAVADFLKLGLLLIAAIAFLGLALSGAVEIGHRMRTRGRHVEIVKRR